MDMILAIMKRELLSRSRRGYFYSGRVVFVLLTSAVLLAALVVARGTGATTLGLVLLHPVFLLILVAACFAAPWTTAPTVAREREDRTLGLLLLSDVKPWQLVLANLVSPTFSAFMLLLSAAPVLILCTALGGVSAGQVLRAGAVVAAAAFWGTSLGLLVSMRARSARRAVGTAVLISVLLFAVLPFSLAAWSRAAGAPLVSDFALAVLAPFFAMQHVFSGGPPGADLWNAGLGLAMGLAFSSAALLQTPFLERDRPAPAAVAARRRRGTGFRSPAAWLCVAGVCLLSVIAGFLPGRGGRNLLRALGARQAWGYSAGEAIACLAAVGCGTVSVAAAVVGGLRAFLRERRDRAFELLLLTPLSAAEVLLGKLTVPLRANLPWIAVTVCALLVAHGPRVAGVMGVIDYLSTLLALLLVSMWISLRHRRALAVGLTAIVAVPWIAVWAPTLLLAGGETATVLLNLFVGLVCSAKLCHRLRRISAGERNW